MENYHPENNNIENNFDLGQILLRAIKYWYIIVICFVLSVGLGFYVYKTTTPQIQITSLLLISDPQNDEQASVGNERNALPGVSLGKYSNIQNQIVLLKSTDHLEKVLKQLNFTVSYFEKEFLHEQEIYKNSPFVVVPDTTNAQLRNSNFSLIFKDDKSYSIIDQSDPKKNYNFKLFEKVTINGVTFTILPNENISKHTAYVNKQYYFRIRTLGSLVWHYKRKIDISPYQAGSSIYKISTVENNVQKGIEFLNKLAASAVQYNLDKKNQIANNTIEFIESQLVGVSDSLSAAEKVLENFRARNELMDVSMQGQMIINQSQELENQKADLLLKLDYFNYLVNYIENNQNVQELMAPSSMGVDNPILSELITELSSKNAEKSSLQFNSRIENPNITRINRHIENLKVSILENTKSLIVTTNLSLDDLNKRLMGLSTQIRNLPKTEQLLIGIERKFKMNDEMYTFLLNRRSEALLAKAANLPDNEIIEKATPFGQIVPNKTKVLFIVLFLGVFTPCGIIFLILFFNNKLHGKNELELIVPHPVIGAVPNKGKIKDQVTMLHNSKSAFSESIRTIRTNLGFYPAKDKCRTIMITSSISGEGKSFFAINLATSYAQLGKKTVLIEFDLRKPRLMEYMNVEKNGIGLSHFLVNNDSDLINLHLIEPTHIPNLEVIPTGDIPPNPAELIAGQRTNLLFEELRKLYDVIIIDTPPICLVTDAQLLSKYSDINIIVARHNVTPKPMLKSLLNDGALKNIKNICMIINAIPKSSKSYSYGYAQDYYSN